MRGQTKARPPESDVHGVLTGGVDVIHMINLNNDFPMVGIVLASGNVVNGAIVEVQVSLRRKRVRHIKRAQGGMTVA